MQEEKGKREGTVSGSRASHARGATHLRWHLHTLTVHLHISLSHTPNTPNERNTRKQMTRCSQQHKKARPKCNRLASGVEWMHAFDTCTASLVRGVIGVVVRRWPWPRVAPLCLRCAPLALDENGRAPTGPAILADSVKPTVYRLVEY